MNNSDLFLHGKMNLVKCRAVTCQFISKLIRNENIPCSVLVFCLFFLGILLPDVCIFPGNFFKNLFQIPEGARKKNGRPFTRDDMMLIPGRDTGSSIPQLSWASWGRGRSSSDSFAGISMSASPGSSWATWGTSSRSVVSEETEIDLGDSSSTILYTPPSDIKVLPNPSYDVSLCHGVSPSHPSHGVSPSHSISHELKHDDPSIAAVSDQVARVARVSPVKDSGVTNTNSVVNDVTLEVNDVSAVQVLQSRRADSTSGVEIEMRELSSNLGTTQAIVHHLTESSLPSSVAHDGEQSNPLDHLVEGDDEGAVGYAGGFAAPNARESLSQEYPRDASPTSPAAKVASPTSPAARVASPPSTRSGIPIPIPIPTERFYSRPLNAPLPTQSCSTPVSTTSVSSGSSRSKSKPTKKGASNVKSEYQLRSNKKK